MIPIQIIELEDRVILKRGLSSVEIPDKNALVIIKVIQKALMKSAQTKEELLSLFAGGVRPIIDAFIEHLINKKFILLEGEQPTDNTDEQAQDIFYWHFNSHQKEVSDVLNDAQWTFVGVNKLSKFIISALLRDGIEAFTIIDEQSLRNVDFFDNEHQITDPFWANEKLKIVSTDGYLASINQKQFLVAASEFGSFYLLEEWNKLALDNDIPFYPILLQNMVGYAGPLVLKTEGACLECLKIRQNSTTSDFNEKRITEQFAFEGQKVVAYHESMLRTLAEVAAFELVKFKSSIQWELSSVLELDLLASTMQRRKVIKAPRCKACSPLNTKPMVNLHKQMTSDENWEMIEQTVGYDE